MQLIAPCTHCRVQVSVKLDDRVCETLACGLVERVICAPCLVRHVEGVRPIPVGAHGQDETRERIILLLYPQESP